MQLNSVKSLGFHKEKHKKSAKDILKSAHVAHEAIFPPNMAGNLIILFLFGVNRR